MTKQFTTLENRTGQMPNTADYQLDIDHEVKFNRGKFGKLKFLTVAIFESKRNSD